MCKPSDGETSFGPLISEGQRDKVMAYIESGKDQGARVVTGGKRWERSGGGFWVEPTILADVNDDMTCVKEEVCLASDLPSSNWPRFEAN